MKLYLAHTGEIRENDCREGARSKRRGSAFGMSLLAHVVEREFSCSSLPEIVTNERGKPQFKDMTLPHFSLSHSGDYVLLALSSAPVGADIERHREVKNALHLKIADKCEREDFDFFELWCLRESLSKLTGELSPSSLRLRRGADGIVCVGREQVFCSLFSQHVQGYTFAVCGSENATVSEIVKLDGRLLLMNIQ